MHRSLYVYTTKKYSKCTYDNNYPIVVTNNEIWDFAIKVYQDIIVETGAILIIKCEVQLPSKAKIIVKPAPN